MNKVHALICYLLLINSVICYGQSCFPEGVIFESQEELDNFPVDYPNCTEIEGFVQIGNQGEWSNINNLEGLSSITYIGGNLEFIFNEYLVNMEGLNNLDSIGGGISYYGNTGLDNLVGFDKLSRIGNGIYMFLNRIKSFDGIESLNYIGGGISLIDNNFLKNINGLQGLNTVEGYIGLCQLDSLISLEGFEQLTYAGGGIGLEDMPSILNLNGLNNLSYAEGLFICNCNNFSSFNGIEVLDTIGALYIDGNNKSLKNLNGLEVIKYIEDEIYIGGTDSLQTLEGIENIDISDIENLTVISNHSLDSCEVESVCNYLYNSIGDYEIQDNAPGCNSVEEVEEVCEIVNVQETFIANQLIISPNPFINSTRILYELKQPSTVQLIIYNQLGQQVYQRSENQHQGSQKLQWDAQDQPEGLYFYMIKIRDYVSIGKLVKAN